MDGREDIPDVFLHTWEIKHINKMFWKKLLVLVYPNFTNNNARCSDMVAMVFIATVGWTKLRFEQKVVCLFFPRKLILLFSKNALNWSKVTVKTLIMLQMIYISNNCFQTGFPNIPATNTQSCNIKLVGIRAQTLVISHDSVCFYWYTSTVWKLESVQFLFLFFFGRKLILLIQ